MPTGWLIVGGAAVALLCFGLLVMMMVSLPLGLVRPGVATAARAEQVRHSGACITSARCDYLVSVYPAGLILEISPVRPVVLLREDVTGLRAVRRAGMRLLAVDHTKSWGRAPLVLLTAPESDLATAIADMTGLPIAA